MEEERVKGDRIRSITTIQQFKKIMDDLVRGYPAYLYFGIFEYYFGEKAQQIIQFLKDDGLIKVVSPKKKGEPIKYRATPKGIDFATSITHLEKVSEYSKETHKFNRRIIFLTIGLFIIGALQLILTYSQHPLFSVEDFVKFLKILHYLT